PSALGRAKGTTPGTGLDHEQSPRRVVVILAPCDPTPAEHEGFAVAQTGVVSGEYEDVCLEPLLVGSLEKLGELGGLLDGRNVPIYRRQSAPLARLAAFPQRIPKLSHGVAINQMLLPRVL